MLPSTTTYLNLNGVPSSNPPEEGQIYFTRMPDGSWHNSQNRLLSSIEDRCQILHEAFKGAIMDGVKYSELIYEVPAFIGVAGHNSESALTKDNFDSRVNKELDFSEKNRFLYFYDCQHLITSIQECSKEIEQIMGEFYFSFNCENFFYPPMRFPDGIRYSSSPVTTKLFSYLSFIFIRMHSLLDYMVKVAFEAEHVRRDFSHYPRLSSANLQYGDRKRVSISSKAETLFETCEFMTAVEVVRNHVIHDALLDDMPKAYERIENGASVEKFILFPDMTKGRLDRFGNRTLFFGCEDKINLRLPSILSEFQERQINTLNYIIESIR